MTGVDTKVQVDGLQLGLALVVDSKGLVGFGNWLWIVKSKGLIGFGLALGVLILKG